MMVGPMMRAVRRLTALIAMLCAASVLRSTVYGGSQSASEPIRTESCFLLFELGVGEIRRDPSEACRTRLTPASTFKVPHALAALDAGVIKSPDERLPYDGKGDWPESAKRDHTLASAVRHSVLWYFQRVAERLGPEREAQYLRRLAYGNMDASSGLTTFWIGGSLQISPEEQQAFWVNLYQNKLAIAPAAVAAVKAMLVQPAGVVINAAGEQPLGAPWPGGAVVSTKTGSATDRSGRGVRWLAGHVKRGDRSYVFVSCVAGPRTLERNAAIDLAARSLKQARVL
jgi:beta-lactamase class D